MTATRVYLYGVLTGVAGAAGTLLVARILERITALEQAIRAISMFLAQQG